jgi:hypothetical protein
MTDKSDPKDTRDTDTRDTRDTMKNVIDLTKRLKRTEPGPAEPPESQGPDQSKGPTHPPASVTDITEARIEIISQERRQVKRTILSAFVGAFVLVPRKGLLKVKMYDISEHGLAFDIEETAGHFSLGEEVAMRVYLSQQSYFSFVVNVQNIRVVDEENVYRHGVNFVKGTLNEQALLHFVKFIETVSASLHNDEGDIMVSSLLR